MIRTTPLKATYFAILAAGATACARPLPDLPPSQVPVPAPSEVESVLYLIGDAGYADEHRNPILRSLRNDIEDWAGALARDRAVAVLFLGDIVYPEGLRIDAANYAQDSAVVQSQVNLIAGPNARRWNASGYFVAGNHDWGNAREAQGVVRLKNLEEFLDRRRAEGLNVTLEPTAGEPGPTVVDFGEQARILLYDTAWWLLAQDTVRKYRAFSETEEVISETEGRFLIIAAHHPFQSASAHGGFIPFWKTFGLRLLLARSGTIMQDLNSIVYRDLRNAFLRSFRNRPPLIFAGGHDHALQVIANDSFPLPRFSLVSGSGSKVSGVGHTGGMRYRASAPGYMRVIIHKNGRVDLFVINAPDEDWLTCPGADLELEQCMAERSKDFTIRFGMRLK